MAIFGNVTDMALADVLSMVGRNTGRFYLKNTSSGHFYELHLDHGSVVAFIVDLAQLEDIFQVRNRMAEMMSLTQGEFEFEKLSRTFLISSFNLSIETLLLSSLSALDEVEAYRSKLPNSKTAFQVTPEKEAWLDGVLLEFWESSYPMLSKGASGEDITRRTGLFADHVLLCLYKLRAAGLISPVRAFKETPSIALKKEPTQPYIRVRTAPLPELQPRNHPVGTPSEAAAGAELNRQETPAMPEQVPARQGRPETENITESQSFTWFTRFMFNLRDRFQA